jgi:hypothetical protein
VNADVFNTATGLIVSQFEGGYYHPNMLRDGRVTDQRYKDSGETMFGIDRLQGGTINETPAGKKFWSIIDNAGAKDNWKWNYNGGTLAPQLKDLAAQMMQQPYEILAAKVLSPQALQIVESNAALALHFIYATWNGPGWFKLFADKINKAVANGVTNVADLIGIAKDSRLNSSNSLIAGTTGRKVADLMDSLAGSAVKSGGRLLQWIKQHKLETGAISLTLIGILVSIYYGTMNTQPNAVQPAKQPIARK